MLRNVACPVRRGAVGKGPDSLLVPRQRPTLHLYDLAQVWARGSGDSKSFKFENPARIVDEMRRKYELAHAKPSAVPVRSPALPVPAVREHAATAPTPTRQARPTPARPPQRAPAHKQVAARAALNEAEQRTGVLSPRTTR